MSGVSTVSGATSENQPLHGAAVLETLAGPSGLSVEEKIEIETPVAEDAPREEMTQEELEARIATIPVDPHTKVIAEHGRIVIEELDTPAIRKEKALRRKAERKAAAAAPNTTTTLVTPRTADVQMHNLEESDLSSLSDLESEDGDSGQLESKGDESGGIQSSQPVPSVASPSMAPPPPPPRREPGVIVLEEGKTLEGGTLGTLLCECIRLY